MPGQRVLLPRYLLSLSLALESSPVLVGRGQDRGNVM